MEPMEYHDMAAQMKIELLSCFTLGRKQSQIWDGAAFGRREPIAEEHLYH